MFGFSENLMRVSLSRLTNKGTIENFQRGFYRLTNATDHLNDYIDEWRTGDARRRNWNGKWVLAHSTKDYWALKANGFLKLDDGLWVRTDNLARSTETLQSLLVNLGAPSDCIIATEAQLSDVRITAAMNQINITALTDAYSNNIAKLNQSLNRLSALPTDAAQKECFHLGGAAIQVLALDPLLPDEILLGDERQNLWKLMLNYDRIGREIWQDNRTGIEPTSLPRAQVNTN